MKSEKDSPNVIAQPPLIYIGGLLAGLLLNYLIPLKIFENEYSFIFGWSLIVISIIIFVSALMFFIKARTHIDPRKSTTFIIVKGPYRFSRNPIYLSMTLLYLGITVLIGSLWFILTLTPVLFAIQYGVIEREEKYLTEKFGETYTNYKKSVRKWL